MPDKSRISSVQLMLLLFMTEVGTIFVILPAIVAQEAGPDGWLSILAPATVYGLAVVLACVNLAGYFPSQTLTEYLPRLAGRLPGKILAAAYAAFFIHIASLVLNEGARFIHVAFFRETPLVPIDLLLAAVAAYGVYLGIEVIARQNELVLPLFIFLSLLLVAFVIKDFHAVNLLPVLENGLGPVLKGSMAVAGWRGQVVMILMLFPYLNQKKEALQSAAGMVIMAAVMGSVLYITTIGVFGAPMVARMVFPVNELAAYVSIGVLERLEILTVIAWMSGTAIKLAVFYHASCVAAANTLGLKSYRLMIIPVVLFTIVLSETLYENYLQIFRYLSVFWPFEAYTFELLIPALLLLVAAIRKKGGGI